MSRRRTLRSIVFALLSSVLAIALAVVVTPVQKAEAGPTIEDRALFLSNSAAQAPLFNTSGTIMPAAGTDFTVEMWAKRNDPATANTRYSIWETSNKALYVFNNRFYWRHDDSSVTDTGITAPTSDWFHVAVVVNATTRNVKLVLNGTSTAWSKTFTTLTRTGGNTFIGASNFVTPYNGWMGWIDQIKVYSAALSDLQIQQSMNTYAAAGITGSPTLFLFWDCNYPIGWNNYTPDVGSGFSFAPVVTTGTFQDVKSVDTTSRPGKTIYKFTKPYLTKYGGFKVPIGSSATFEYLVVGGGGGGGGNRGGGGGAGGLASGTLMMPFNATFSVLVGAGGYSAASGYGSSFRNVNASSASVSVLGGGAGGSGGLAGSSGASGGGAGYCSAPSTYPSGGAGTSGQGFAGGSLTTTECATSPSEVRATGGGGGSASAGVAGSGGAYPASSSTSGQVNPDGGAGTSSSIAGSASFFAAGGGGAVALASTDTTFRSAWLGAGGSSIGGNGAAVDGRGSNAVAATGSGGGGGGYQATDANFTGGYGSGGVIFLIASSDVIVNTAAAGATLATNVFVQPTFSLPSAGTISITGCSAQDANGNTAGVSVSCTPVSSSSGTVSLTDLRFTAGTQGQFYTVIYSIAGKDDIRQEMYLGFLPASVTVASTGATANYVWDGPTLMATSSAQAVTVLSSEVQEQMNFDGAVIPASGQISVTVNLTSTTAGKGIMFMSSAYSQSSSMAITTAGGPVTIWNTNPNAPTGVSGINGVNLNASSRISTNGGNITIGGGANPATSPMTAETGVRFGGSARLEAGGGNISIRADSVVNNNLNAGNFLLSGIYMSSSSNQITTTGNGSINIVARGTGVTTSNSSGFMAGGFIMAGNNNLVSVVNGTINISATNNGAGNYWPVSVGTAGSDTGNSVTATGSGSITISGDGSGTTTTTNLPNSVTSYGISMLGNTNSISTVDGNISLTGRSGNVAAHQTVNSVGSTGVHLAASRVLSTGTGNISINGTSGNVGVQSINNRTTRATGVFSSSYINTSSGSIAITGLAGTNGGVSNVSTGINAEFSSALATNQSTISSSSGAITLNGDTLPMIANSSNATAYGIVWNGYKFRSTSGNISLTGTACSTCSGADAATTAYGIYSVSNSGSTAWNEATTGGAGTLTLVGRADYGLAANGTAIGLHSQQEVATRSSLNTETGQMTLTGSAARGFTSMGVRLITSTATATSGNVVINGYTTVSTTTLTDVGARLSNFNFTTSSGNITLTGLADGTPTSATGVEVISNASLKTVSGNIAIDGRATGSTSNVSSGTSITGSSILSGTSATSTTGGTITILGYGADRIGQVYEVTADSSTIDTFNNSISITAGQPGSTAATSNARAAFTTTGTSNWAATASSLTVTAHGPPSGGNTATFFMNSGANLTIGGPNSGATVTLNVDGIQRGTPTVPILNINTTGDVVIRPNLASFQTDSVNSASWATDAMNLSISTTNRVRNLTIGKPGNTRALTLTQALPMDSTNGNLVIHAGSVTASQTITTNTLAVNSSGSVNLSSVNNSFNRVAVVRGSATSWALTNTASSWIAGTYSGVTGVFGVPSRLRTSGTAPTSVAAGVAMASYSVIATDGYDNLIAAANTRSSDSLSVTVSKKTGASTTLGGTLTKTGTAGAALVFDDLTLDSSGSHTLAFNATNFTEFVSPAISVTSGPPTLTLSYFGGTNATTFVSDTTTATASFTSNSVGARTYTSLTTSVCSVNSSGTITTLTAGSCDVRMNVAADANYAAGSIVATVSIAKSDQATLVVATNSVAYATTATLSVTGGSGAGAVSYSVDSGTCSISGTTLTVGAVGDTCFVTATKAGTVSFNSATSASKSISVTKASQSAIVVPSGVTMPFSSSGLNLAGLAISGGNGTGAISFATTTTGCSISSAILTSTNDASTACAVSVLREQDNNYNASAATTLSVSITKINQPSISVTSTSAVFASNLSLTFSGGAGTGAATWSVVSGSCTISGSTLSPTAAGSCVVRVTKAANTNYNAASSADTTVTIDKAAQAGVTITSANTLQYLNTLSLTASGGSGTSAGYSFSTSTPGCAISGTTLSSTLSATGTCTVAAFKVGDTNYFDSTSVLQTITIIKASQLTVATIPSGVNLAFANSAGLDLSALSYTGGDGTGAWTFSTSTSGCTITGTTLTSTNNAASTCVITVIKAADANYNASSPQSMTVTISKANQAPLNITTLAATYLVNLSLAATGGTTAGAVTYSKVSGSCTISGAVLTPTGGGSCVVTATMAGGTNYNDVTSANTTVSIAKANQTALNWNLGSTSVPYLGTLTLATSGGSGTGALVYTVSQNSACAVAGNILTVGSVGSVCDVTATKVADSNFNSADTTTQSFTVTPISQASISFTNASVMTFGQTLTVLAIGGSGTGTMNYSISNAGATGCTLSEATLSVAASGTCVIAAQRSASTNYTASATATQSITVNQATQSVSFTSSVPATPIVGDTYSLAASTTSGVTPTFSIGQGGCTIAANVVTFTAANTCRIDVLAQSNSQYLASTTVSQTVAVGQRNQTLNFDVASTMISSKTFGDPAFALSAVSSVSDLTATYSRGSNTTNNACLVSLQGLVTVVAVGTCEVLADQPGDSNTAAASTIRKTFTVLPDLANAPTILSVSAGHQTITAAFARPSYTGGAAISGFQIVATHSGGTVSSSACPVVAGSDQTCSLSGLTNGTPYTIKVAAINSAGIGFYSSNSVSRTPATNPAAVSAFTAIADNTTLQLSWQNPISLGGGTFDSYRIFVKPTTVANYPSTYLTVGSMATTSFAVTNLINGVAYDAKIITVTTANTLELTSNTAEVRETPRTVPDAPASILVFEVGANLVVSWTSPVSDGGNAVSEYLATISGVPCVLATPTDTTCSVMAPSAPGNHPIEVKAKNAAGFGVPITSNFARPSNVTQGPSIPNSGSEVVFKPRIRMLVLDISSGRASTSGGTILTFKTVNMEKVSEVLVSGDKAKILFANKTTVRLQMPKHAPGPVTIRFIGPNGSLDLIDAVTYVKGRPTVSKVTIRNFIQENATLSSAAKKSLRQTLASNPGVTSVTCIGYQSWTYDRPIDAMTAVQRARAACTYLKSLKKSLVVNSLISRTSLEGVASRKLEVIFK